MSGLQSKIKLQARKETMFQTKYGTDTIPNTSQTSLRARRMEEIVRNLPTFSSAWFSKQPTSNIPTILNTRIAQRLKISTDRYKAELKKAHELVAKSLKLD
jgi:hypothetical protein